jgi:EmrB/QacA subfamily drug resistance transporter
MTTSDPTLPEPARAPAPTRPSDAEGATDHGEPPRRLALIMVSLILALVPLQLDGLVAATALPTIAGDLGGFDKLAWIAAGFLLTMAIGTITAGRIGDLFGRRRVLLVALSTFLLGSLWSGLAGSMDQLVAARAIQGFGAGMTFTTLLAVVADVVPPRDRARYQGILGAIAPFSMIIGPWVGGIVTDHLGWRWIFLLNLPLIGLSILGAALLLRLPTRPRGGRVDVSGLLAVSLASAGVVLAVTWGGHQYAWTSWQVLGVIALAAGATAWLVVAERRATHPVLPPDLFRNRGVVMAFVVVAITTGAVMQGSVNYLPAFLQLVQGRSASSSGLLLLPLLLPAIGTAIVTGGWTSSPRRFRPAIVLGTAILTAACGLLATMGTGTSAWLTAGWMALAGVGIGLLFQTPLVLVQNSAPTREVGAATGATMFMRTIGGAIGVGALGAVFTSTVTSHVGAHAADVDVAALTPGQLSTLSGSLQDLVRSAVAAGTSHLFWVAAALGVVAVVAALALPRRVEGPAELDGAAPGAADADDVGPAGSGHRDPATAAGGHGDRATAGRGHGDPATAAGGQGDWGGHGDPATAGRGQGDPASARAAAVGRPAAAAADLVGSEPTSVPPAR